MRLVIFSTFLLLALIASPAWTAGFQSLDGAKPKSEVIKTCGPSFFRLNRPAVGEEHAACLDEIAIKLKQEPKLLLVLDGHRDSKERKGISLTRANFARCYLITEQGIEASRIIVRNFGDTCPHEAGDWELNKRVEQWLISERTGVDEIMRLKKCASGSTPQIITTEKPASWKGVFTDWEIDAGENSDAWSCLRKHSND